MDNLNRSVLRDLADKANGLLTSLYMPTHKAGPDIRQGPIRLRNLLRRAEESYVIAGVRRADAKRILDPAWKLLDDSEFWQHQSEGLAIFAGDGFFRRFSLPILFEELLIISDRLHIKPLLPLFAESSEFLVLAISLKKARLLQCTHQASREWPLIGMPTSLDEAMQGTVFEKQGQAHTTAPKGPGGERAAVFHSMGDIDDEAIHKKNIQEFVRMLARGVDKMLVERRSPLVLAGTDYIRAVYHQASQYGHIAAEGISGSPDHLTEQDLRDRAWTLLQPHFGQTLTRAVAAYRSASGTTQASRELAEIVPAAYQGRIGLLFVSLNEHLWGRFDPVGNVVELHPERQPRDHDLLDMAAVYTLLHHGQVFAIPQDGILNHAPAAAVLRTPGAFVGARMAAAAP